jgi:hypothetical protein
MNALVRGIRLKLAVLACGISVLFLIHANLTAERSIRVRTRSIREHFTGQYDQHRDELESNNDYETTTDGETTTASPSTFTTTNAPEQSDEPKGQCDKYPDTLLGRVLPNTTLEIEWDQIHNEISDGLQPGGCWAPTDCEPRAKTAIIVPYKDRELHLKRLLYYLHPFLRRQQIAYCIFVAEQFHEGRFNKGILMNAGFEEALKIDNFDCVVFHDVDMLPEDDRNTYACGHVPIHLSLMINK